MPKKQSAIMDETIEEIIGQDPNEEEQDAVDPVINETQPVEELKVIEGWPVPNNMEEVQTEVQTEIKTEPLEVLVESEGKNDNLLTCVIVNCNTIDVFDKPQTEVGVKSLTKLTVGDKVTVDQSASNPRWFKVLTESGIEGYCMTKFIKVK